MCERERARDQHRGAERRETARGRAGEGRERPTVCVVCLALDSQFSVLSLRRERMGVGLRRSVGGKERLGSAIPLHGVYCAYLVGFFSAAGGV